jgi:hypothetical protein
MISMQLFLVIWCYHVDITINKYIRFADSNISLKKLYTSKGNRPYERRTAFEKNAAVPGPR